MEDDRRRLLRPPRSPPSASSQYHQYSFLLPLLQHNSATRFFNAIDYGGSGNSPSGYSRPSSSSLLPPTAGGSVDSSARHARSFSELPSLSTPSLLQSLPASNCLESSLGPSYGAGSSDFQAPLPPVAPASGWTGGTGGSRGIITTHARSFSLSSFTFTPPSLGSSYGSGSSYFQTPASPLAPASGSAGGIGGSNSHARSFSLPPFFSTPEPDYLPPSPLPSALEDDLDLDAGDDIVSQYVDLDGLCGVTSGDDTGEANGAPLAGSSQTSSANSSAREVEYGREEQHPAPSPVAPSAGSSSNRLPRGWSGSMGSAGAAALFELASQMLREAQVKKVMGDESLVELMLTDPNRVKRLLASRAYAARVADRKAKHRSELENRVEMLKMEINTLSLRLMWLQSKVTEIKAENNQMKIKLQSMEKVAYLRDALNETLNSEIEDLKRAINETGDSRM